MLPIRPFVAAIETRRMRRHEADDEAFSSLHRPPVTPLDKPVRHRIRLRTVLVPLSWVVAILGLLGLFLGAAGVVMVAAGERSTTTWMLVGSIAIWVGYLTWFFRVGPGSASPVGPSRPASPQSGDPAITPSIPRRRECWFCGAPETRYNRLVWAARAAICEECADAVLDVVEDRVRARSEASPD